MANEFKQKSVYIHNIITNDGMANIAQRLSGDTTNTAIVNYVALGTIDSTPTVNDPHLGGEVYRKELISGACVDQTAYLETFFSATETSGTYEEYGMFIDGTSSADSGVLFNRFTETITKSTSETLNVSSEILIANA